MFTFFIISQNWNDAGNCNISLWRNTSSLLYFTVNTMTADDPATQGARASAAIVLTLFFLFWPQQKDWDNFSSQRIVESHAKMYFLTIHNQMGLFPCKLNAFITSRLSRHPIPYISGSKGYLLPHNRNMQYSMKRTKIFGWVVIKTMLTSSNGNIFCINIPFVWGIHQSPVVPLTKGQ